jgi:hypothetical protein
MVTLGGSAGSNDLPKRRTSHSTVRGDSMPNRIKTIVTATLILLGGVLHLSHPPTAVAIPCTAQAAWDTCNALGWLLCTSLEADCSFGCSGGEITSFSVTCP